jgi:transposase, IS605 orfB family
MAKPKEKATEMTLVEQVHIKPSNPFFSECDHICFLSKNLYNATLYQINTHYEATGEHLNYKKVNLLFTHENNPDYRALPAKVSKHTQMLVDQAFSSYFALLKKKKNGEHDGKIHRPHYLKKVKGRQGLKSPTHLLHNPQKNGTSERKKISRLCRFSLLV